MIVPELTRGGYRIGDLIYPRVSSILGIIAKPGIDGWKRKVGFEQADAIAERSTTFGTLVHAACERVAHGEPSNDVARSLEFGGDLSAAQCVSAFARWLDESVLSVVGIERTVWSERYRYAGTADLLVELLDGRRAVCDIKTSKSLSEGYRLQLEAYRMALEEMGEPYEARLIVWLPSTHPGVYVEREYADDAEDRRAWQAALCLYQFVQRHGRDWIEDKELLAGIADGRHDR